MNLKADLGVQSYCFRAFKENERVAALVREMGVSTIELCAVHVDFKQPETWDKVLQAYADAEVRVVSVGVQGMSGDEPTERRFFEFARQAGAQHISVTFRIGQVPQAYRVAEQLAAEFDVKLGIHNHGGYDWLGSTTALEHALSQTNERIGLCLDTAWALDASQNPVKTAEQFLSRLYGAHLKDFVFDRAKKPSDVVIGEGNLDLPAFISALQAAPSLTFAVIEYEGDIENPLPALKECVTAAHNAIDAAK